MGILDDYMKQVELDKANENDEIVPISDDIIPSDVALNFDKEEYIKELKRLRNDPNDISNKFKNEYPSLSNDFLNEKGLIKTESINAKIIHVYCPKCGKELIAKNKLYIMPYTGQHIAKHECECGFKANLEDSYPKIIFGDENKKYEISYKIEQ